jgi:chemotaxis signal transduction protein
VQELDLAFAAQAAVAAEPTARLLRLWHGGVPWAVAGDSVVEVVGTERLQRNPRPAAGSPYGWLLGESEEIPVFLPPESGLELRAAGAVVVLQPSTGPRCGLGVDSAEQVREVPLSRLRLLPAPADLLTRWAFPRIILGDDGVTLEIAPEAVPHLAGAARGDEVQGTLSVVPPAAGVPQLDVPPLQASSSGGLVVFILPGFSGLHFALPAAQVVEVLPASTARRVPGVRAALLGLCAWRGEPLPVLDLALAVGLPSNLPRGTRGESFAHGLVARARRTRQLIVFPVERIVGVRQGPFPQPANAAPPFPGARQVLGAFAVGEQMLVVPDLDGALWTIPAEPYAVGAVSGGR